MMRFARRAALAALLLAACAMPALAQLDIPFAPPQDTSLHDPDNPTKVFRIDFARVEHDFPLSRAHLMRITPDILPALSQEQVDQIFGRLTAGPTPDGIYLGRLFRAPGDSLQARAEEILGGLRGSIAAAGIGLLQNVGNNLWKGKVFYRDRGIARTMVQDRAYIRPLIDNPATVMTATIPNRGPLRRVFQTDKVWLLFPAKVHCGHSLLDGRRESIVIDHNFNDEVDGYRERPDSLMGRGGLRIRDELRMIRPGFYLGRAYINRVFLANFTLYNPEVAGREEQAFRSGTPLREECWAGEQARAGR